MQSQMIAYGAGRHSSTSSKMPFLIIMLFNGFAGHKISFFSVINSFHVFFLSLPLLLYHHHAPASPLLLPPPPPPPPPPGCVACANSELINSEI
jgi:hypothetical protein